MAQNRFVNQIAGFLGDIGRAHAAAAYYREMSTLSDAALKARGLSRSELATKAFEHAGHK